MTSSSNLRVPLGLALLTSFLALGARPMQAQPAQDWAKLARQVEIIRDRFGVPHIYGPTDASVVFGAAWAQAEDNWWQVEDNFVRALGRGAELHGDQALVDDYLARSMRISELSRGEYEAAEPALRALLDAYAAGFNSFLEHHPDTPRRLLSTVEPWYALALIRFKYHHNEFLGYAGLRRSDTERLMADLAPNGSAPPPEPSLAFQRELSPNGERSLGSNEMAVAGRHTAARAPLLLINPHVSFFGLSQYWEVHLESAEGLRFSGQGRYGFMLPYMGHSDVLGWTYTDNYADIGDLYLETFDDPAAPARYRYGPDWRPLIQWSEDILSRDDAGRVDTLRVTFRATHHGPIVGVREVGGRFRPMAARVAKLEEGGWYAQWYGQMKARSFDEWKAAVSALAVPYQNTMYADRSGNIFYLYNSAVPRRDPSVDWLSPVDGSDPSLEWRGYHTLEELPQVLNPTTGWLQNTNSDPLRATDGLTWQRSDFPSYMIGSETHNARAVSATRILRGLAEEGDVTLARFAEAVLDTRLSMADSLIPLLIGDASAGVGGDGELARAVELLGAWDREADTESVATTLFVRWATEISRSRLPSEPAPDRLATLQSVLKELQESFGTWEVPWGRVNRLQRPDASGTVPFDDSGHSIPVPAAPGWLGSFFTFHTQPAPGGGVGYGVHGDSFVKVISFGERIEARSILTFGESGDPGSPHYFDQAPLYAAKRFKPAWFSRQDVEANAARRYRPGGQ